MEEKPLTIISYVFGIIVGIIIVSSFALSFTNLNEAAIEAGVPTYLSPLFPLSVDLFLLVSSIFILRANLVGESAAPGWSVLLLFTAISVIFNVVHSPAGIMSRSLHAVPPIALCISMELFMLVIKGDIKRHIVNVFGDKPTSIVTTSPKVATSTTPLAAPVDMAATVRRYLDEHPDATNTQCAQALSISRSTVSKYRNQE